MKVSSILQGLFLIFILTSCNFMNDGRTGDSCIVCNGNSCYNISTTGEIINKSAKKTLQNIPVTISWEHPSYNFTDGSTVNIIYSGSTGGFNSTNTIDTTLFTKGFYLKVTVPSYADYIVYPSGSSYSVYSQADTALLNNLKYEYYQKTQLQIKLERVSYDNLEKMTISHYFRTNYAFADKTITKTGNTYNSELNQLINVETAANVKTYVCWTKIVSGIEIAKVDTITCKPNTINVYEIRY